MLLTERKLRKLIKNILLEAPDGLYPQTRDIVLGQYKSDARTSSHYGDSEKVNLIRDILLGLSGTGGVVVDAKDAYNAYTEGEDLDFFIAMAGFIPGVGEAAKLKKLVDAGDKSGAISLLKNAQKSRKLTDIARLGFKIFKPEPRHLELIHASHISDLVVEPLAGRITRQSKRGSKKAGFYAYPQIQDKLPTAEDTVKRAKNYVADLSIKNPEIDKAYVYSFSIKPDANFVEEINPSFMGMTRISPEKAKKYYDSGIDVIITKSVGLEEVIIINKDVITSQSKSVFPL